jgi:hypothetical protein
MYSVTMSSSGQYQYATSNGYGQSFIYVSNNYGVSWTLKVSGSNVYSRYYATICCDSADQYVAVGDINNNHGRYSKDYGVTWATSSTFTIPTSQTSFRTGSALINHTVFFVTGPLLMRFIRNWRGNSEWW